MGLLNTSTSSGQGSSSSQESNRTETSFKQNGSASVNKLARRLQDMLQLQVNCGYQFIQQNGQRIFEPCSPDYLPPQKGCEVFIGNIPKHVFEDELIPLFQKVGRLYKFRLMLDFNQRTRGYGFATYFYPEHVKEAIDKLNGYQIGKGLTLAVYKSIDNRRLFVGNIPKCKTRDDVYSVFSNYAEGMVDVIMYTSWKDKDLNRGFAFLEFESHIHASVTRRQLHPRNLVVWDHALYVDWADPVPEVNPVIMAQVSVLYVKNLPYELDSDNLHVLLQGIAGLSFIKKTHKILTYAFVHCKSRRCAEIVMEKLRGLIFTEQEIEIEWARPREYSTQWRALHPPDNFCLSVPLRARRLIRQITESRRSPTRVTSEMESKGFSICSSEKDV